jgi:putative transposase
MPTYVRWRESGATYFFTVVTYNRSRFLTTAAARQCLRQSILSVQEKWPFEMPVSVLLPDHLHCIWRLPEREDNYPLRWRRIKEMFTRSFLKLGGREARVSDSQRREQRRGYWQPRYWEHLIRNEEEYLAYRDYIHLNPVKHSLVREPEDWPWSSIHQHLRNGWLEPEWKCRTPIDIPDVGEPPNTKSVGQVERSET